MIKLLARNVLRSVALLSFSACFTVVNAQADFFFSDGLLHAKDAAVINNAAAKNMASLRILPYVDQRIEKDSHLLGTFSTRVMGLTGTQLLMDRDVASIATEVMKRQFGIAGFPLLEDNNIAAKFELTGVVKTLTLNARERDNIHIILETKLTDVATGKVLWLASVTQTSSRFAGVAGDNRNDLINYLYRELTIVSDKTVNAVNSLLMASYPALFNLTPGTKTIDGVTVLSTPLLSPVTVALPTPAENIVNSTGTLVLTSQPTRAKVYVDDVYFGLTPLRVELDAGLHIITTKLAGRKTETEKISLRKAETIELEMTLGK
ncbi:MAG: hypothetical protein RL358_179 [Pseudomonadota bacterium]|jgi:hypothetical protein